jgi:hypothetical protein
VKSPIRTSREVDGHVFWLHGRLFLALHDRLALGLHGCLFVELHGRLFLALHALGRGPPESVNLRRDARGLGAASVPQNRLRGGCASLSPGGACRVAVWRDTPSGPSSKPIAPKPGAPGASPYARARDPGASLIVRHAGAYARTRGRGCRPLDFSGIPDKLGLAPGCARQRSTDQRGRGQVAGSAKEPRPYSGARAPQRPPPRAEHFAGRDKRGPSQFAAP